MKNSQVNTDLLHEVMTLELGQVKSRMVKNKVKEVAAETAIRHFRRFFYLAGTQDKILVPTRAIAEVWHEFIIFTKDYTESCFSLFGKLIHHQPSNELSIEPAELNKAFSLTAKLYKQYFGEEYEDLVLRAYSFNNSHTCNGQNCYSIP